MAARAALVRVGAKRKPARRQIPESSASVSDDSCDSEQTDGGSRTSGQADKRTSEQADAAAAHKHRHAQADTVVLSDWCQDRKNWEHEWQPRPTHVDWDNLRGSSNIGSAVSELMCGWDNSGALGECSESGASNIGAVSHYWDMKKRKWIQGESAPPLNIGHRGRGGIGYKVPALEDPRSRHEDRPHVDHWDAKAHDSNQLVCLSWNAGDLDRRGMKDAAHLKMITNGRFHIVLLQEASSTLMPSMCDDRAVLCSVCPDGDGGNLAVLLGASGTKRVRNLFGPEFAGRIPNTMSPNKVIIGWFHAVECTWEHLVENKRHCATRAGQTAWRVCTVHFNNLFVKRGADSVGLAFIQFFYLMLKHRVRIISGDMNQGYRYVNAALTVLRKHSLCQHFEVLHAGPPGCGAEIVFVVVHYEAATTYVLQKTCGGDDKEYFGIPETDNDTHTPLVAIVATGTVMDEYGRAAKMRRIYSRTDGTKTRRARQKRERKKLRKQTAYEMNATAPMAPSLQPSSSSNMKSKTITFVPADA